jgi:SHS2 domain-containing protein
MVGYKFFPHTADVLFEAYGKTMEEVFVNAALAVEAVMVNLASVDVEKEYSLVVEAESEETLLYNFLSELIFVKDTEGLLFKKVEVTIVHKNKQYELHARCDGDLIDREKQELLDDAKAITMHQFKLEKKEQVWTARVIVDV